MTPDFDLDNATPEQLEERKRVLQIMQRRVLAKDGLVDFARLMMPNPDPDPEDDETWTNYEPGGHHWLLATALERVESGKILRLAISMPPQHGKTTLATDMFSAWYAGRNPRRHQMVATYSETYSTKRGAAVRELMRSEAYKAVFPNIRLNRGSQAKDSLWIEGGGQMNFIGRGGAGTGLPADLIIIDDPLKNAEEANSPTTIEALHEWFSKVIYTRARATTAIVVIHTRWIEDDLIGRLCDPDHPWRRTQEGKDEAAAWTYINIPAILGDDKVTEALGRQPGEALWPEQFTLEHLISARKLNPRGFESLYQGRPTPEDGDYFKAEWLMEYEPHELPKNLRVYGASDHAVTEKQENDASVLGRFGIDENDDIWILPELVWERMETDRTVEELLSLMRMTPRPEVWWLEGELISKSFGPFLRKRMHEERVYVTLDPIPPQRDLRSRARSIQGRMAMKKVHFPKWMPWWPDARAELLKFPRATHDDFVAFMAMIGLGLTKELSATGERTANDNVIRVGSREWVKRASAKLERRQKIEKARAGW